MARRTAAWQRIAVGVLTARAGVATAVAGDGTAETAIRTPKVPGWLRGGRRSVSMRA
jgi:hypothetical protein